MKHPKPPPIPPPEGYTCDICEGSMREGQGYGLRGKRGQLQYTKDLEKAEKHICHGCLIALQWVFNHSVGDTVPSRPLPMRFDDAAAKS